MPSLRTSSGWPRVLLAAACFVLSGAAALVYQVAWQRLLALSSGVAVYSVAAITAAFMAGMSVGSYAGGVWSRRLSRREAVRAFALLEFGLAAFAMISVPLYYDVLYGRMPWLYETPARSFFAHLVSLAVPTVLMGISLPLLVRGLVSSEADAPRTIGLLYAANTLGAAFGAFATPWILLRFLGVDGAIQIGAAASALAAFGGFFLSRRIEDEVTTAPRPLSAAADSEAWAPEGEGRLSLGAWAALYALSGFVALSLEMLWFRVLDVVAKGAAFTFGTLLGVYLLGLAGGTLAASLRAGRIERPLRAFIACQGLALVMTLLAHVLLTRLPPDFPVISWIVHYGTGDIGVRMEPFAPRGFLAMYVALPVVLFGPATFLMGLAFPILQRAVQDDPQNSGRRVGLLQAANIAGCTLGSLVTGLFLLDQIGTAGSFRLLAGIWALVTLAGARVAGGRRLYGLAAALVLMAALFPSNNAFWIRLLGNPDPTRSFIEEDAASVTALTPGADSLYKLWINGRSNSWLPFEGIHTLLGALPAVIHPAPRDVAIIGLGSGDTAWAASVREETASITVFEIAPSQARLLAHVEEEPPLKDLHALLSDRRLTIVKDDGRKRLRRDGVRYDLIEADAVVPGSGLAGHLYSVEFYSLVSRSLKPGGVMCAWIPTQRAKDAALQAFPFAIDFGFMLLLSNEEIAIDIPAWRERLTRPRVMDYFGEARIREIDAALGDAVRAQRSNPRADVNRDLQPKDEFSRPLSK